MAWNAKNTHKKFFSSDQLLPQIGPESDGPGREYLHNLGPGRPFSGLGRYSTDRSAFVVFTWSLVKPAVTLNYESQALYVFGVYMYM